MIDLTKKEKDIAYGCGRDMASGLLSQAVTTAEDNEMMDTQVFICRRSAISILAIELYNEKKLNGTDPKKYLKDLMTDIVDEEIYLDKSGMIIFEEIAGPDSGNKNGH